MKKQAELTKKIACAIIEILNKNSIYDTTQMKINKLVYDVLKWYGVLYSKKDFENPKAYKHGPIFESLRKEFGKFKSQAISTDNLQYSFNDIEDEKIKDIIEKVIKQDGKKTAKELRDLTHNELWEKYNKTKTQVMEWDAIIEYYKNHLIEATNIEYDIENNVHIATSNIIDGLVLELDNKQQLEKDIQEVGEELIKLNY